VCVSCSAIYVLRMSSSKQLFLAFFCVPIHVLSSFAFFFKSSNPITRIPFSTNCPTGTSAQNTGRTSCASCVAGKYSDTTGATGCTSCSAGTYNPSTGSTSASACVNCAAGTYSSADASISCTNCASGKTSNSGATSCTASGDDDTVTDDTPLDDSTDDIVGDDDDGAYTYITALITHAQRERERE
jgi:hypothetical protein